MNNPQQEFKSGNIEIVYESTSDDIEITYETGEYYDESGRVSFTSEFNDFNVTNNILEVYLIDKKGLDHEVEEMDTRVFRALVREHFKANHNEIINELIESYLN